MAATGRGRRPFRQKPRRGPEAAGERRRGTSRSATRRSCSATRCRLSIRRGRRRSPCARSSAARLDRGARAEMRAHPLLDQRLRQLPDIDVRVEPRAHALGHQHGLLQQQELRLHRHLELLGDPEQLREQAARTRSRGWACRRSARRSSGRPGRRSRATGRAARSRPGNGPRPPRDSRGAGRRPACRRDSSACRRSSRPMMPKSTGTMRPSRSTKMLPPCRSAWKKPSRNTW